MRTRREPNQVADSDEGSSSARCIGCDYRLTALPTQARCPECGAPISLSLGPGPPRIEEPAEPSVVPPETRCVRCGRPLGSLPTSDSCPGCGVPVWLSRHGDWLCVRHPRWLRRVRLGLGIWVWVLIIPVVLAVVGFVTPLLVSYLWNVLYWHETGSMLLQARIAVSKVLSLLVEVLELIALLLITVPNPAATDTRVSLRRLLRMAVVAYVVARIAATLVEILWEPGPILGFSVRMPVTLVLMFVTLGVIEYMRRLIRRLPNRRLERSSTILLWGFVLLQAWWLIEGYVWLSLSEEAHEEVWSSGLPLLTVGTLLLFVILSIWLAVVVVRFRRALPSRAAA